MGMLGRVVVDAVCVVAEWGIVGGAEDVVLFEVAAFI